VALPNYLLWRKARWPRCDAVSWAPFYWPSTSLCNVSTEPLRGDEAVAWVTTCSDGVTRPPSTHVAASAVDDRSRFFCEYLPATADASETHGYENAKTCLHLAISPGSHWAALSATSRQDGKREARVEGRSGVHSGGRARLFVRGLPTGLRVAGVLGS
jgi:hypothetical protein